MSTRSLICKQIDKNLYEAIYCHSDGYLTYNGAMLIDHYKDEEKLTKLIDLGNISSLYPNLDPDPSKPHSYSYNERQENVVIAYGRDCGEKNQEKRLCNLNKLKKWPNIEYIYIFTPEKEWIYSHYPFNKFESVQDGVDKEYKRMGIRREPNKYGEPTEETIKAIKKRQQKQDAEM